MDCFYLKDCDSCVQALKYNQNMWEFRIWPFSPVNSPLFTPKHITDTTPSIPWSTFSLNIACKIMLNKLGLLPLTHSFSCFPKGPATPPHTHLLSLTPRIFLFPLVTSSVCQFDKGNLPHALVWNFWGQPGVKSRQQNNHISVV